MITSSSIGLAKGGQNNSPYNLKERLVKDGKTMVSNYGWITRKRTTSYETDLMPLQGVTHYTAEIEVFWYEENCTWNLLFQSKQTNN